MKRLTLSALAVSVVLLVPLAASHHLRVTYINTVAHWKAKVSPPRYVVIGDSISAGGSPWGWRLDGNPFSAVSLASNGVGLRQIANISRSALAYRPQFLLISGGTNDIAPVPGAVRKMISDACRMGVVPIVTIPPWTASDEANRQLAPIREQIRQEAKGAIVVSLDELAPKGVLLPQYRTDGVHLSPAAYAVWEGKLREAVSASLSDTSACPSVPLGIAVGDR